MIGPPKLLPASRCRGAGREGWKELRREAEGGAGGWLTDLARLTGGVDTVLVERLGRTECSILLEGVSPKACDLWFSTLSKTSCGLAASWAEMGGRWVSTMPAERGWSGMVAMGRDSGEAASSWILEADRRLTPPWSLDFVPERSLVLCAMDKLLLGSFLGVTWVSSSEGKASVEESMAEWEAEVSASETAQEVRPS